MALRKHQFNITIGVHDPSLNVPAMRDEDGRILRHAQLGVRYEPPGTMIEMEDEEAAHVHDTWGKYGEAAIHKMHVHPGTQRPLASDPVVKKVVAR